MRGFRKCKRCGKERPEEVFHADSALCRWCERETVVRIARGIVAQPREAWAKDLLARMRAEW